MYFAAPHRVCGSLVIGWGLVALSLLAGSVPAMAAGPIGDGRVLDVPAASRFSLDGPWSSPQGPGMALDLEWRPTPGQQPASKPSQRDPSDDWPAPWSVDAKTLEKHRREIKVRRILARIFHSSGWPLAAVGTGIIGPTTLTPSAQNVILSSILVSGGITLIVNAFTFDVRADRLERHYFPADWETTLDERESKRPGKARTREEPEPDPDEVLDDLPEPEPEPAGSESDEPEPEPEEPEEDGPQESGGDSDTPPWE